jgi:hypothetical protein
MQYPSSAELALKYKVKCHVYSTRDGVIVLKYCNVYQVTEKRNSRIKSDTRVALSARVSKIEKRHVQRMRSWFFHFENHLSSHHTGRPVWVVPRKYPKYS